MLINYLTTYSINYLISTLDKNSVPTLLCKPVYYTIKRTNKYAILPKFTCIVYPENSLKFWGMAIQTLFFLQYTKPIINSFALCSLHKLCLERIVPNLQEAKHNYILYIFILI